MNDINSSNPAAIIAHEVSKLAARHGMPAAIQKAADTAGRAAYNAAIGSGSSTARRFAIEKAISAVRAYAREAIRKSEADAVAPATSGFWDFSTSPTAAQASADDTRGTQAQAIAELASRRMELLGEDPNDAAAMDRAVRAVVIDYSGGNNDSFDQLSARSAASARETGFVWPTDMASPRAVADAEEAMAEALRPEGAATNYAGRRNDPRSAASPMPAVTGFSGSGVPSFPAGVVNGDVSKRGK